MKKTENATDKANKIIDQSKQNPPMGSSRNPGNAGMNVPNADKVADEFKKNNNIDDEGHVHNEK